MSISSGFGWADGEISLNANSIGDRQPPLSPYGSFQLVREAIAQYLETAYKIGHPAIHAERSKLLRAPNVIADEPYIESTPAFPRGKKLKEVESANQGLIPAGLSDLVQFGVDMENRNLYQHQHEAILNSVSDTPNLLVATGTGSGKTEAFLLPVLIVVGRYESYCNVM